MDFEAVSFDVGSTVQEKHLTELQSGLHKLESGKIWLPGFIPFQCGKLSKDCRPHLAVLERLELHRIPLEMVEQPDRYMHGIQNYQRMRIIARDGLFCLYTGEPIESLQEAEVDHFIPKSKGGENRDENLFVASKAMNRLRKDKDVEQFCQESQIPFEAVLLRVNERLAKGNKGIPKGLETLKEKDKDKKGKEEGMQGEIYHPDSRTVLHLLNEASGFKFREMDCSLSFISQRLSEPEVSLEGVKLMIHRQVKLWKGTDMNKFLRPETLFNKTKFDSYYAMRAEPTTPTRSSNQKFDPSVQTVDHNLAALDRL